MIDTSAEARARHDGAGAESEHVHEHAEGREEIAAWLGELRDEIDRSVVAFRRTVVLQKAKLEVAVVDGLFAAALGAVGGLVGAVLVALGTALVVLGLRGGLRAATDGAWWVDVVLGAVLLGVIAGGLVWTRRRAAARTLGRTRDKLAGMESSNGAAHANGGQEAV